VIYSGQISAGPDFRLDAGKRLLFDHDGRPPWLKRGIEQRDPKMTFLKVEPKWNNLRGDPGFRDLLRRIGLLPESRAHYEPAPQT
jgi:hypothetical protein